ncbi:MAG: aspartate carbamoyltransferase regulatory subunit [archaeon]
MSEKELTIKKIKNGTVIDHLPAGSSTSVAKALGIHKNCEYTVAVAMNVKGKSGTKDIVKIEDKILRPKEINRLALIAPKATINIIKDYTVAEKKKVEVPDEIEDSIKCANPNCVTNQGEPIVPLFTVESKDPIRLRCKFCERIMEKDLIEEQL